MTYAFIGQRCFTMHVAGKRDDALYRFSFKPSFRLPWRVSGLPMSTQLQVIDDDADGSPSGMNGKVELDDGNLRSNLPCSRRCGAIMT